LILDSTSSSITLTNSSKTNLRISTEDEEYVDDFDNDEEDDWKPKKKKKLNKDLLVGVNQCGRS
jgi:hypothetical protein